MKETLDKIKIVLGDEGENLCSYNPDQLLFWVQTQRNAEKDIREILENPEENDIIHQLSSHFVVYDYICGMIEKQEYKPRHIEHLNKTRKDIIETINSWYKMETFWVLNTKHQLKKIIDKLQEFKGDLHSDDFLNQIETQKDIRDIMAQVNESLPIPDNTQCNDWLHAFNRSVRCYIGSLNRLEEGIKNKIIDQEIQKQYQRIEISKTDIIASINSLNDISFDIKKKSLVRDLSPYVKSKCPNTTIEVEANAYIDCNNRVFKGIINELSENYRKYGTDGKTSVTIDNDMLTISLLNKKKEKNPEDFSSKIGLKIFDKYMKELGGLFEHNYDSSDCITIIRLPIHIEKQK